MRYLTIAPDYTQSCIQDDFNGPVDPIDLNLPPDLIEKINLWHSAYKAIIPLEQKERNIRMKEIEALDTEGLMIANQLMQAISEGAKVRYYSEGKLQYLNI